SSTGACTMSSTGVSTFSASRSRSLALDLSFTGCERYDVWPAVGTRCGPAQLSARGCPVVSLGYSKVFTVTMVAGMGWSVWALQKPPPSPWLAAGLVAFSLIVPDLISGLLHVVLDTPRSLALGPIRGLAQGFQRHHQNPSNIYEMPLYQPLYVMHMP